MARRLWLGIVALCGIGVGAVLFVETRPRVHTARPEEIRALVPAELLRVPPRDPDAEARLDRVVALAGTRGGWTRRLEAILDEGPLRIPEDESSGRRAARQSALELYQAQFLVLLDDAGYEPTSGRSESVVRLGLRLFHALDRAGGDLDDAESLTVYAGAIGAGYEVYGHYGTPPRGGRLRLLGIAPASLDRSDTLAAATLNDFRRRTLPLLVKAAEGPDAMRPILGKLLPEGLRMGTFDPLDTTRLFVAHTKLEADALRATDSKVQAASRSFLLNVASHVPQPGAKGLVGTARYHWAMDHSPNSLGGIWLMGGRGRKAAFLLVRRSEVWRRLRAAASPTP